MTSQEAINALEKTINDVQSNGLGEIMVKIGSSALVKIRERIIGTGNNAEGAKYPPYSIGKNGRGMLSGCKNFIQKDSCENYIKTNPKWVMVDRGMPNMRPLFVIPGGYKQFRELNRRQSGFVDFSFSGQMWRNIKVVSNNAEHNHGVVRIAATTDLDKAKLEGNTKRKGDILKLSHDEISLLSDIYKMGLVQIFHNNGL